MLSCLPALDPFAPRPALAFEFEFAMRAAH
jgi:hypothetical protein